MKWYDALRYGRGLPHATKTPWFIKAIMVPFIIGYLIQFMVMAMGSIIFLKPEK
jgi:hypothetical protein